MNNSGMTPYKRVITALRSEFVDKIPFTAYEDFVPICTFEREMRSRGLCVVKRICSYKTIFRNVDIKSISFTDEMGRQMIKTIYSTPFRNLWTLVEPGFNTSWTHEFLFKSQEDYKGIRYLIENLDVVQDYDNAANMVKNLGEDFIVRDNLPLEPMQSLLSSMYMSAESFSYEWHDNRDEIIKLYEAFCAFNRRVYPIVAEGPLEIVNYGGNVVPQIIGREVFEKYYLPHYDEAADILHQKGKLIGCHFDADNTTIMDLIARSKLDYVEAYDPCMSPGMKEARKVFGNKVIWINWPSAWHLRPVETVSQLTHSLIEDVNPQNGFIIGITEDIPTDRWMGIFKGIMDGIEGVK